jgi:tetratricopeptide (TPR) repeat protein
MQKAIEIDPSFAMAYRSMAMSFGNLGYSVEERKHLQKAFELTDRLSDRERYLIQGDFYRNEMIFDKAIEAYDKLLELYPDDHTGANNSAIIYLNLEDWDKAIERYKVAVGFGDPSIQSHVGLAASYAAKGLYDKCEELLKSYLQDISESINIRRLLVRTQIIHRNYKLAQAIADETSALFPDHYRSIQIQGSVFFYKGELLKAEEEFQKLLGIEYPMVQLDGRERLSALYLLQGRFKEAINQGEKGLEIAKKLGEIDSQAGFLLSLSYCHYRTGNLERALEELEKSWNFYVELQDLPMQIFVAFAKGMTYVEMQAMGEAQRTADEIIKLVDQSMNRKLIRYYDNLVGRIELKRGNISKALEQLKKAESSMYYQYTHYNDHAMFIDPLALAYFKEGDLEKARLEYEKLTHLTLGRTYYGDIYAKSFYMLGKTYEQQGDTAQAIDHFEKFLDLWKDADPGMAEVEDAKKRLNELK